MLVLSLDTTTRAGSVAVVRDELPLSEIVGDPSRTHGERLPRDLMRALEAASVPLVGVELLAVAAGPGSFTGLRVGIAAMQGLAMAIGARIVPVSALDALASAAANAGVKTAGPIGAWMDAQRGEVFASVYDTAGRDVIVEPTAASPSRTLAAWAEAGTLPTRFIGDGAVRYAESIRERVGRDASIEPPPPLAATIGRMAIRARDRAVLPHAVVPIYIRRPDAELARDRRTRDRT